jgi:UDP:flavonoid glycosyltransferase YjiC (YdhE family)
MSSARLLFFAEAVTLAHLARPAVLAAALSGRHQVTLARPSRSAAFVDDPRIRCVDLDCIPGADFLAAIAAGRPPWPESILERYVATDLALIDAQRPDLIIGDLRLSLSVSARLRGVPYLAISNAYWSPWYREPPPLPVLPWTARVPLPIARAAFALLRGPALAWHARPLDRVRRSHGLPPLGASLRRAYTDADWLALADVPELYPTPGAPPTHRHLGAIPWSPPAARLPAAWGRSPRGRPPIAYLSLGSSGQRELAGAAIDGLLAAGFEVWHACAGDAPVRPGRPAVREAAWLPGALACARADIVVCNGGSLGVQQALAAARPIVAIASNMDQFLNMGPVASAGAGRLLRADRATAETVRAAAAELVGDPRARVAARRLARLIAAHPAVDRFRELVADILDPSRHPSQGAYDAPDQPAADRGLRRAVRAGRGAGGPGSNASGRGSA